MLILGICFILKALVVGKIDNEIGGIGIEELVGL